MRSTPFIAALSLGIALAGCKKSDTTTTIDNTTTTANSMTEANGSMGSDANAMGSATAAAMPAQKFVDTIAGSDMFEIQSGKLAETMGSTAAVKDFGKKLVTDHTKSSSELKAAAAKTTPVVALPMILPADLKAKITALKATKGADFDKLFAEQQTEGHQTALDALKAYAAGGDQESLKGFASKAVPVVQGHLTDVQGMAK